MDALRTISTRITKQSEPARPDQVRNAAGGYSFKVGDAECAHRFLLLGTEGGTYYTSEDEHTKDNAGVILRMAASNPLDLVRMIVEMSTGGRAPRQNPCIFALAVVAGTANAEGQRAALAAVPDVCRTFTHLALFNTYVEQFRGRGPALNKAVGRWYTENQVSKVAYQMVKFRQREGWGHNDVLRKVRPIGVTDTARRMAFNWVLGKGLNDYEGSARGFTREQWAAMSPGERAENRAVARPKLARAEYVPDGLAIIADFEDAQAATKVADWVNIISRGNGLSWEMLPDAAQNESAVWEALLHSERGVPQHALIRQLGRLARLGLCDGDTGRLICAQIVDPERLKRARVHPINLLVAAKTYAQGHGIRGDSTWPVVSNIVRALSDGFPAAYVGVEPAGKRTMVAVDGSGSMWHYQISGMPLSPCEAAGAIATVTGATETDVTHVWFTTRAKRLDLGGRRLDDVLTYLRQNATPEGTDCSLPMQYAIQNNLKIDTFIVMTDGETWAGRIHPFQALEQYRQKSGINARMISVAMTASGTSIRCPDDALTLDVVGFDTVVPQMAADFSAGRI